MFLPIFQHWFGFSFLRRDRSMDCWTTAIWFRHPVEYYCFVHVKLRTIRNNNNNSDNNSYYACDVLLRSTVVHVKYYWLKSPAHRHTVRLNVSGTVAAATRISRLCPPSLHYEFNRKTLKLMLLVTWNFHRITSTPHLYEFDKIVEIKKIDQLST